MLHDSEDEVMADEGTLLCQMKFVTNSHLLRSRSYKVCAVQVIICYTFLNMKSSPNGKYIQCVSLCS